MTSRTVTNLGIAVVVTAVIALLDGAGWPSWLIGAVYALALAVGVWCGSAPTVSQWTLRPATHATAAAVALVVGGAIWWLSGRDNGAWWGVGVIMGIASSISVTAWQRSR